MTEFFPKKTIVIGFIGTTLDKGSKPERWHRWRPTLSLLMHDDLQVDELHLLNDHRDNNLVKNIVKDSKQVSPNTQVTGHTVSIRDPWDFADVYGALYDFVRGYQFDTDNCDYLLHITTGTHVAQICWYLLIDAHYLPAKIIQSSPTKNRNASGKYRIIDLDLSRYDDLKQRFDDEQAENWQQLKSNIATANPQFNRLISEVELVATRSQAPILIMGATGVGKSHLAKQIYQLKVDKFQLAKPDNSDQKREQKTGQSNGKTSKKNNGNNKKGNQQTGRFVDVNCATLRGDSAMSALFGHVKGAFTGAEKSRDGLLKSADGGILFLDEIGELGLDEQAMLLKALEDKTFFPVGSDVEVSSNFQLIAGTNKDLRIEVQAGRFREDLFARLNTWTFYLPNLQDRPEDIAPNIEFELQRFAYENQRKLAFTPDAHQKYLQFAMNEAVWKGNFRDLTASITRMATLANAGANGARIDKKTVEREIDKLRELWQVSETSLSLEEGGAGLDYNNSPHPSPPPRGDEAKLLSQVLSAEQIANLDEFDRIQLVGVLQVCKDSRSMAEAGRRLFAVSRTQKQSNNDSDRVKKYLAKFGIKWGDLR